MKLTPRVYSPRAAVFVNGYNKSMTEFVGENINTGKNIPDLSFIFTTYRHHSWVNLSKLSPPESLACFYFPDCRKLCREWSSKTLNLRTL